MAKSDLAVFRRQLIDSERVMDALFQQLAEDVGNLVFRAQGLDGTVPIEALPRLQKESGKLVRAQFLDASGRGFDDNNEPLAPFPKVIAEGQKAMIDVALERTATILDKALPEDLRLRMAARPLTYAH